MEGTPNHTEQVANKAFEACGLYADTTLQTLRQLTDLSANVANESVNLYAALQASTLKAMQEGQALMLQRLSGLQEAPQNPTGSYQQSMHEFAESTGNALELLHGNSRAILRTIEQYWSTARQTGNNIQANYTQLADKMKSLYSAA